MNTVSLLQIILGILVVASALTVVTSKNAVVSAITLMTTLLLTGVMYLGLGLYFIGAIQILIYTGAVAVLFVFIVMLLDLKQMNLVIPGRKIVGGLAFIASATLLLGLFLLILPHANFGQAMGSGAQIEGLSAAHPKEISLQFLTKFMAPFQIAGLLIFAAVMGAVVLGRPRKNSSSTISGVNS